MTKLFEIDNVLPMSELYYIEDLFYEDSYDIIHHNRRRKKKRNNTRSRKNISLLIKIEMNIKERKRNGKNKKIKFNYPI